MHHVHGLRSLDLSAPDTGASLDVLPRHATTRQRREFLRRSMLGAFAASATAQAFADQAPAPRAALPDRFHDEQATPRRYPDPDVVVLDNRFKARIGNTPIVRLHRGMFWAEGPAWSGVGRHLVFSDIPANEVLRWNEEDGHVGRRFRSPSQHTNGNSFDAHGRQLSCCHQTRNVIRYEWNGSTTVLADQCDGKPFNAPNDIAVHPDGWMLFTDPGYGSLSRYEGNRVPEAATSPRPLVKEAIYRIDAPGQVVKLADEPFKPNGICFSPDYRKVYVADTGPTHYPEAKGIIWSYDVDGRNLRNPKTFASMAMDDRTGLGDGLRCDEDGNVWVGAGWGGEGYDGVHVFHPDGTRIGLIRMPEVVANVCFGGTQRNRLFIVASRSLYALYVETRGGTPT